LAAARPSVSAARRSADGAEAGLARGLRGLAARWLALARTRGELLQTELEEEKLRLAGIAVYAVVGAFFLALSVLVLTFLLILLFWDGHRVLATALIGGGYLLVGVVFVLLARSRAAAKSTLFSASLGELKKDVDALREP
jgi:uncharacterized membrane protein YqjE